MFIYGLADPDTRQIRYVGLSRNPRQRFRDHRSNALVYGCIGNGDLGRWWRTLNALGKEPVLIILEEEVPPERAEGRESHWMAKLVTSGADLLNIKKACQSAPAIGPRSLSVVLPADVFNAIRDMASGRAVSMSEIGREIILAHFGGEG